MSTALERTNSGGGGADRRTERPGFAHRSMACDSSIYDPPELCAVDRRFPVAPEEQIGSLSSSSTSSIGKNSDESTGGVVGDEEEVQSDYKGGPLDSLEALEDALPVKKSISKFYCGKSKSFTNLSNAGLCSSISDITKPENAYTRKRKNLLDFNMIMEKNRKNILRSRNGGISKRPNNSRSMLALAPTMDCSEPYTGESSCSNSSSPRCCLPPLPPHARRAMHCDPSVISPVDKFSSWRSFSLSDLQGAAAAEASKPSVAGSWANNGDT